MDNSLNERVVATLKKLVPQNEKLVSTLGEMFSLSKEAVYRRLRGDVCFTLAETAKLSSAFGFSMDKIIHSDVAGRNEARWAPPEKGNSYSDGDYIEEYCSKSKVFLELFKKVRESSNGQLRCATNMLPRSLIILYEKLSTFYLYKWAYLMQGFRPGFHFSDIKKTQQIIDIETQFLTDAQRLPVKSMIIDSQSFMSIVNDILYFFNRKLITKTELLQLQDELLDFVLTMENITSTGSYQNGTEATIYLSKITLDSTYIHLEYEKEACCLQSTCFVEAIQSYDPYTCNKQKNWIEMLKRYSIQITQSNEEQRFDYFNDQRRLIEEMLSL